MMLENAALWGAS